MESASGCPLTAQFGQAVSKAVSDIYTLGWFLEPHDYQMHVFKTGVLPRFHAKTLVFYSQNYGMTELC